MIQEGYRYRDADKMLLWLTILTVRTCVLTLVMVQEPFWWKLDERKVLVSEFIPFVQMVRDSFLPHEGWWFCLSSCIVPVDHRLHYLDQEGPYGIPLCCN